MAKTDRSGRYANKATVVGGSQADLKLPSIGEMRVDRSQDQSHLRVKNISLKRNPNSRLQPPSESKSYAQVKTSLQSREKSLKYF